MAIKRTAGTIWIASDSGPVVYEQAVEMTDRMIYFPERNDHCGCVKQVPMSELDKGRNVGGSFHLAFLGRSHAEARNLLICAVNDRIARLETELDEARYLKRRVYGL